MNRSNPLAPLSRWLTAPDTHLWRVALVSLAWVIYPTLYVLLRWVVGPGISALSAFPALLMAFFFGGRAAALGVGMTFGLNSLLFFLMGEPVGHTTLSRLPGLIILGFAALLVAGLRDMLLRLQTTEARYHRLFDIMPVMAVLTRDQAGEPVIADCNQAFLLTLGYTREEVIGRPLTDFYTPVGQQALHEGGYQAALHGALLGAERQLRAKDGRVRDTLLFAVPEQNARGHTVGTLALFVDITERKRLEASLRRREQELALQARVLALALKTTDMDTILREVLQEAMAFTDAEMGGIFLRQEDAYVLRHWENTPDNLRAAFTRVPVDADFDWLREFTLVREPLSASGQIHPVAKEVGIQVRVSLPLRLPAQPPDEPPLAVLLLAARDIHAFNEAQVATLRVLVDQLALAVAHVRAVRQAQERLTRLQALREIDRAILEHLDLDTIVRIVLEKVPRGLGADAVALSLVNETSGDLEVFAMRLPNGTILPELAFDVAEALRWFMDHPEPLVVYDLTQDPRLQGFREVVRRYGLVSYLGVPLRVGEHVIGVLHILTTQPRVFADEDLAFFTTLAGQAAIAIANARLVADLESRARAVETLLQATVPTETLLTEHALERFLLRVWREALDVAGAAFYRVDADARVVRLVHREGFTGPDMTFPLGEERGLAGWVAHTRTSVYVPDTAADPRWVPVVPEIRSAYLVPVVWGQRLLGVAAFYSTRGHAFPSSRQRLIDLFVQHGAAWLENARYLREAQAHMTLLKTLQQVATDLEGAHTEAEVTATIGRGVIRLCRPEKAALFLRDDGHVRCAWQEGFNTEFITDLLASTWELPSGHVLREGRSLLVSDIGHLPPDSPVRAWAERGGYRAFFLLPLVHEGRTLGYLGCYWTRPYHPPPYEQEVMETFARLAATALQGAHLYETLLQTNKALEEALQARDDMLRNVTHELRTPLTMIRGYAELVETGIVHDPGEIQEHMQVILRNAVHLQHLIDQLLLFQRLRFGEEALPLTGIDLVSWLQDIVAEWEKPLAEAGIRLVFTAQASHLWANVYPDYLRQVVANLLDNARKFSPEGGTVRVRVWQEGNEARIAVSDEGIGIPPDKLDRVFDRFYQVDPSPTRRYGGMGIGLALAKQIVEQHGGRIWAESAGPGRGTTFIFTVPLAT